MSRSPLAKFTRTGRERALNVRVWFIVGLDVIADDASSSDLFTDEEPECYLGTDQRVSPCFL